MRLFLGWGPEEKECAKGSEGEDCIEKGCRVKTELTSQDEE